MLRGERLGTLVRMAVAPLIDLLEFERALLGYLEDPSRPFDFQRYWRWAF